MATPPNALLAWLCLLLAPMAGVAADAPAASLLRFEIDAGSASVRAPLASHWSARATVSARYDTGGADPARPALHQATVQAGVAWDLTPRAQLDVAVQRGMSPDMPSRALALNWRLRY